MWLNCRLGSNPEKVFPFSVLQDQLRKFGRFGLANASILLPIMAMEIDGPNSKNQQTGKQATKLSDAFNRRIRDIVADMYRLGYI